MSLSVQVNQYWQLSRVLLFPARFLRWLFAIIFSLVALGCIFQPQATEMYLAIGAGVSFLLLSIMGMQVPGQMLALASSKQFRHLADLRVKLFAISFVFSCSAALIASSFFYHLESDKLTFWDMLTMAIVATSFITTTLTIIAAYYPPAMAVYPIVFFIALPEFFQRTLLTGEIQSLYLWGGSAFVWAVFYVWWKRWHPKKYLANAMLLSSREIKQHFEEKKSKEHKFSSQPHSLSGSLLIGQSDGFLFWFKREIILPFFFLGLGLVFIVWRDITPEKIPEILVTGFLFFLIAGRGGSFLHSLHKNLYRLWMNTNKSRMEVFYYLEKAYFSYFFASTLPAVLFVVLVNHFFFDDLVSTFYFGYLLLIATLFVSYSYYLGLVIYAKLTASQTVLGWILLATYICLITGMVFFNILWGQDISQDHADYLWFSGGLVVLTVLFRQWARSSWKKVNFYRAKS